MKLSEIDENYTEAVAPALAARNEKEQTENSTDAKSNRLSMSTAAADDLEIKFVKEQLVKE